VKKPNVCSKTIKGEHKAQGTKTMTAKGRQTNSAQDYACSSCDGVPRGQPLRNELANISGLVEKLESAVSSLPYVGADGSSECPFAESLFAQKEDLEMEVSDKVHTLANYLRQLDAAILESRKRSKKIQADYGLLNRQEPQDWYAEAVRREQERILGLQDDQDAVSLTLTKAKAVLAMSAKVKFPGKKPQRQYPATTGISGTGALDLPGLVGGTAGQRAGGEIAGLISLGPQGPGMPPR
jgi:hypothetical protein